MVALRCFWMAGCRLLSVVSSQWFFIASCRSLVTVVFSLICLPQFCWDFIPFQLCVCGRKVTGHCNLIDRRQVELRESESDDLFASDCRQVVRFSRLDGMSSAVPFVPIVAGSVLYGQPLAELGCWYSQTSSTSYWSWLSQIVYLLRWSVENGVWGTTNGRDFSIF